MTILTIFNHKKLKKKWKEKEKIDKQILDNFPLQNLSLDSKKLKKLNNTLKQHMQEWKIRNCQPIWSKKISSGLMLLPFWLLKINKKNSSLKLSYTLQSQSNLLLLAVSSKAILMLIMKLVTKMIILSYKQTTPLCFLLNKLNNSNMLINLEFLLIKDFSILKKDSLMKMMELKFKKSLPNFW